MKNRLRPKNDFAETILFLCSRIRKNSHPFLGGLRTLASPATFFWTKYGRTRLLIALAALIISAGVIDRSFAMQDVASSETPQVEERSDWLVSLESAMRKSRLSGRHVLVKFEADWCLPCRELAKELAKEQFSESASNVVLVKIDVDSQPELADKFDVSAIPTLILIDFHGEVVAEKNGMATVDECVEWLEEFSDSAFDDDESEILTSTETPTRTEIADLILFLGRRDVAIRQISMERIIAHPVATREAVMTALLEGKLAAKLSALEILQRWQAPVEGVDPWIPESFTDASIERLQVWASRISEEVSIVARQIQSEEIGLARLDIEQLLETEGKYANQLARFTRYGAGLLPTVYEMLKEAEEDFDKERLTALRYWLVASNRLRLEWPGGLVELASRNIEARRLAASTLVERATGSDEALLLEIFADPDALIRELGLKALNRIGSKQTDLALARLLNDPDPNVKAAVLKQLAESPSSRMISTVAKYLETETDSDLIVYALKFLKEADNQKSYETVLKLAEHESWQVRAQVAEVLTNVDYDEISKELAEQVSQAVLKLIVDPDGFVVSRAIEGLPPAKTKKSIKQMTDIALKHPELAEQIAVSISGRSYDNYGSGNYFNARKSKTGSLAAPFFEEFLKNDSAAIRAAGVIGLTKVSLKTMDTEYLELLKDTDGKVRMAAAESLIKKVEAMREFALAFKSNSGGADELLALQSQSSSGPFVWSNIKSLFGRGRNDEKQSAVDGIDLLDLETLAKSDRENSLTTDAESETDGLPDADEQEPEESEVGEQDSKELNDEIQLPPLKEERWIQDWIGREKDPEDWMAGSVEMLENMRGSDDEDEIALATKCLIVLGRLEDALKIVSEKAGMSETWFGVGTKIMPWLPIEQRTELFHTLLDHESYFDHFADAFTNYSSIRNPDSASEIWQLAGTLDIKTQTVLKSLTAAYFGKKVSTYGSLSDANVDKKLIKLAIGDANQRLQQENEARKLAALALLFRIDIESAKSNAIEVFKTATSPQLRQLALRVSLMSDSSTRKTAIQFLESADKSMVKTILRFLAFGKDGISSPTTEEGVYLYGSHSESYSTNSRDKVKVRIPKPPTGLDKEMVQPWLASEDDEINSIATYLMVLLEEEVDTRPLFEYWESNAEDESVAVIIYQAIAVLNDDKMAPMLEKIYEKHGKDNSWFASRFYWTIRPMSGAKTIKLRSRIRKEIGFQTLNNYS